MFWWFCGSWPVEFRWSLVGGSWWSPVSGEVFYFWLCLLSWFAMFYSDVNERRQGVYLGWPHPGKSQYGGGRPTKKMVGLRWSWCINMALYYARCWHCFRAMFMWRGLREGACGQPIARTYGLAMSELSRAITLFKFPRPLEWFCLLPNWAQWKRKDDLDHHKRIAGRNIFLVRIVSTYTPFVELGSFVLSRASGLVNWIWGLSYTESAYSAGVLVLSS